MKRETIEDIAMNVDATIFNVKHQPGKAQQIILDALNVEAESFGHANAIFAALGFSVEARRVGLRSVPFVHLGILEGGAINREGEGEYWDLTPNINLSVIAEWVVK